MQINFEPVFLRMIFLRRPAGLSHLTWAVNIEIFSSFSLYKVPSNERNRISYRLLNLKLFKKKFWKIDNFVGSYVHDPTMFKKFGWNEKSVRSLHNIISYQTCLKKKTSFYLFSNLIYFGQGKATILICCLVTGCHGNSHHPKPYLLLFFLGMLSGYIKISSIKITN